MPSSSDTVELVPYDGLNRAKQDHTTEPYEVLSRHECDAKVLVWWGVYCMYFPPCNAGSTLRAMRAMRAQRGLAARGHFQVYASPSGAAPLKATSSSDGRDVK